MRRELARNQLSRFVVWTGDDGPVPAAAGVVGVEYRGRLGHPSSYGLLMAHATDSLGVQFDIRSTSVALSVPCDEVALGLTEPEYRAALFAAGLVLGSGLVITGAGEGQVGSSVVVFTRLAAVLSVLLAVGPGSVDDAELWATWDEPWRARRVPDTAANGG
ncbi:hypothetical protein ABT346_30115 [Micromonospora peucetia]|uniref:hypothetical protein n=1 Tax=Micromonospora peucetia TaxID=47871 RepID=UPI00331AF44B